MFVYFFRSQQKALLVVRLYRSETNKKIAGVCAGFGEMMDVDPTIVRLVYVALMLITGLIPLVIVYLIAWWIVPSGSSPDNPKSS